MSGRVVHFEIPFDDGDRARAFYGTAFGWEVMAIPEMDYTVATTGPSNDQGPTEAGYIGGGLMQRQEPFLAPNIVFEVANIEDALKSINAAGGSTVSEREQVGDMGFAAYFRDTEGNLIGIWENAAG